MPAGLTKLLDNYERSVGVTEQVTTEELTEINLFLDAVLDTEVMKVHLTCYHQLYLKSPVHFNSPVTSFCSTSVFYACLFSVWMSSQNKNIMYITYVISCFVPHRLHLVCCFPTF